jgi:hypothetical protein
MHGHMDVIFQCIRVYVAILKEKHKFDFLVRDERAILKYLLRKYDGRVRTRLIYLMTETSGGLLQTVACHKTSVIS